MSVEVSAARHAATGSEPIAERALKLFTKADKAADALRRGHRGRRALDPQRRHRRDPGDRPLPIDCPTVANASSGTDYWLRITPAEGPPFDRRLTEGELIVGRATECDLALADPFLSRQHARLLRRGETVEVEDLGSSNGTRLNGEPVTARSVVRPGDLIELSGTTMALHTGDRAGAAGPRTTEQSLYLDASLLLAEQARPLAGATDVALRRAAERLRLLNEVHEALARSLSRDELLEMILDRAFDLLGPEEGAVYLRREGGAGCERAAFRSRLGPGAAGLFSTSLEREVHGKGLAALVLDVATDDRFAAAESMLSSGVRSLVAAPMLAADEGSLGMIVLNSRLATKHFTQDDLELLVSLASVAALRLRNIALAEEAAERRRLEAEVGLAREIQVALLPRRLPAPGGWELHAENVPSRGVSGDFYLALERGAGRELMLMVADVSGKGIGAALVMASLEALCGGPLAQGEPPEAVFAEVSPLLLQRTEAAKYATVFLAAVEPATGRLRYASAGHEPALLVRAGGETQTLGSTGPPLGLLAGAGYQGAERRLEPGDLLAIYSDGIVEATDRADREYGLDRLTALCRRHCADPLATLTSAVEADLRAFAAGVPFADDRTLLLLRRGAAGAGGSG
jgi:serine phosphatase RsbU (regulator of sigma subunit)